jgi:hypothetical protein
MPLQNRVDPFGELVVSPARGLFMGNRGGRFHTHAQTLTARRWVSRQWICCVTAFKERHRDVWGRFYTELFFLDEPTALAAGHRPCFECRRKAAENFAAHWRAAHKLRQRPRAATMDEILHRERLDGRGKRRHRRSIDGLPAGAFIASDGDAFAVRDDALLRWSSEGYAVCVPRPRRLVVDVLTPPAILLVLASGYQPHWHPTAIDKLEQGSSLRGVRNGEK